MKNFVLSLKLLPLRLLLLSLNWVGLAGVTELVVPELVWTVPVVP